mmetsp:Transcript_14348/g.43448  ORF Transcript_14348/g.43448 Transcript_14348/m.43448 type:complete len:232 (+) Transcript_14348:331-1026(+)
MVCARAMARTSEPTLLSFRSGYKVAWLTAAAFWIRSRTLESDATFASSRPKFGLSMSPAKQRTRAAKESLHTSCFRRAASTRCAAFSSSEARTTQTTGYDVVRSSTPSMCAPRKPVAPVRSTTSSAVIGPAFTTAVMPAASDSGTSASFSKSIVVGAADSVVSTSSWMRGSVTPLRRLFGWTPQGKRSLSSVASRVAVKESMSSSLSPMPLTSSPRMLPTAASTVGRSSDS